MITFPLAPRLAARLLLRLLGEGSGHPFHGNQYVAGLNRTTPAFQYGMAVDLATTLAKQHGRSNPNAFSQLLGMLKHLPVDVLEDIKAGRASAPRVRAAGGLHSGNFGHAGRPGSVGGSAPSTGGSASAGTSVAEPRSERSALALQSYVPTNTATHRHAKANELAVRRMIGHGAQQTDDNLPMDVVVTLDGKLKGVEVKTMLSNTRNQITVPREALERKRRWGRENHASLHTVVIDDRGRMGHPAYSGHRLYYARGSKAFRLSSMTKVENAEHLQSLLRGQTRRAATGQPVPRVLEICRLLRRFDGDDAGTLHRLIQATYSPVEDHSRGGIEV